MLQTHTSSFKLPGRQVVHQKIDDETIIVHLINGFYYSLVDSGGIFWDWLMEGSSIDEMVRRATAQFDASQDELRPAIEKFVQQLLDEQLLVGNSATVMTTKEPIAFDDATKISFQAPELVKFTDMEGILDLDPVHEVDENGWPAART